MALPCCHCGAFIVSIIHSGKDGSSIAIPIFEKVIDPAKRLIHSFETFLANQVKKAWCAMQLKSGKLVFLLGPEIVLCIYHWSAYSTNLPAFTTKSLYHVGL